MDKNNTIGFILIILITLGFFWYNSRQMAQQQKARQEQAAAQMIQDQLAEIERNTQAQIDSLSNVSEADSYKSTYSNPLIEEASRKSGEILTIQNDLIRIEIDTKGAQPHSVLIKDYVTYDSAALYLIRPGGSHLGFQLYTQQMINTESFVYETVSVSDSSAVLRLHFDENSYIEQNYALHKGSYMLDFNVSLVGMDKQIPRNSSQLDLSWNADIPRLEKGYTNEKNYSNISYHYPGENTVENLGQRKDKVEKELTTRFEWFSFQQQFFSALLVNENNFTSGNFYMAFYPETDSDRRLMTCQALAGIQYNPSSVVNLPLKFYFGPNRYSVLKSYDKSFEKILFLGRWIISWINRGIIIPMFDFFSKYIKSFGLIILLLTLIIKMVISPLTIRSYMSSAKMSALRPEIEKINAKYPRQEDAMKKQQETMNLYRNAGVKMMGGCLPMLLQFPVLFAMFRFFPASFELRGQSFLWAEDLSTYDSILDFGFNIPMFGNNISLFAIL